MDDAEKEARDLLRAYRDASEPDPDRKAAAWAALAAATAGRGSPAGAPTSPAWIKVGLAVGALALVGGGAAWLAHGEPERASAPAPAPIVTPAAPEPAPEPIAATTAAVEEPAPAAEAPVARRPAPRPAPDPIGAPTAPVPEAPAPATGGSLAEELAMLRAAQRALGAGDPTAALAELDRHAARFPEGALANERRIARVAALCDARRDADARAEAAGSASPAIARALSRCRAR